MHTNADDKSMTKLPERTSQEHIDTHIIYSYLNYNKHRTRHQLRLYEALTYFTVFIVSLN